MHWLYVNLKHALVLLYNYILLLCFWDSFLFEKMLNVDISLSSVDNLGTTTVLVFGVSWDENVLALSL